MSFSVLDAVARIGEDLGARVDGPMAFRFVLQPAMAAAIAIRDGFRDGKAGKPPYFLAIIGPSDQRKPALIDGLRSTARILVLAIALDVIYQIFVSRSFYPGETLLVAVLLAVVPYTLLRGPVSRIVRLANRRSGRDGPGGMR
jgi:hypothetical protein